MITSLNLKNRVDILLKDINTIKEFDEVTPRGIIINVIKLKISYLISKKYWIKCYKQINLAPFDLFE